MASITRPNKTIGGGSGNQWIAGADLYANELNDDINTIYTDYNGNITNVNCAAGMALAGSKLASSPDGITTDKINDLQITTAKIANLAVTAAKIAAAVPGTSGISKDKINFPTPATQVIVAASDTLGDGLLRGSFAGFSSTPSLNPSTDFILYTYVSGVTVNVGTAVVNAFIGRAQDNTWKTTYTMIRTGGTLGTPQTLTFTVNFVYLALT